MKKVLIIGATSAIAQATARIFAAKGNALFLVGRGNEKVTSVANDLKVRGSATAETMAVDLLDFDQHPLILKQAIASLGGLDVVLIAHGTLGDQQKSAKDYTEAERELRTNLLSVISLLTPIANYF